MAIGDTPLRSTLIKDAQNLPDLVAKAEQSDPQLAESLTQKSLVGSKTVWFPLVAWGVTAAVSHYGIGWDATTCTSVASLVSYLVVVGVRYISRSSIGSILPKSAQ